MKGMQIPCKTILIGQDRSNCQWTDGFVPVTAVPVISIRKFMLDLTSVLSSRDIQSPRASQ